MTENTEKKTNVGLMVGIGCAVCLLAIPVLGIVAAIAIPNFVSMQYKSKRAEIPTNLSAIKTVQMAYYYDNDVFVEASAYPLFPGMEAQMWNASESGGFQTLGWIPDGMVRGSYSVTTTLDDFRAIGLSDIDGDGNYATYVATKSTSPMAITPPDVY